MPFNLLLFPLIGGYLFLIRFNRTKFYHQRIDRQKLLFNSSAVGLIFLLIAYIISALTGYFSSNTIYWVEHNLYPKLDTPYLGTTLLACLLGPVIAFLGNLYWSEEKALFEVYHKNGSELEKFLYKSLTNKWMISMTLTSNKVYAGYVKTISKPSEERTLIIHPMLSGYRDLNTKKIQITTDYIQLYEGIDISKRDDFYIIIKVDDVTSVNRFDPDIYAMFNRQKYPEPRKPAWKDKWSEN
jgi:hypothetical protein